jgi:hypothetical protein
MILDSPRELLEESIACVNDLRRIIAEQAVPQPTAAILEAKLFTLRARLEYVLTELLK